jgi:hypothetical protein
MRDELLRIIAFDNEKYRTIKDLVQDNEEFIGRSYQSVQRSLRENKLPLEVFDKIISILGYELKVLKKDTIELIKISECRLDIKNLKGPGSPKATIYTYEGIVFLEGISSSEFVNMEKEIKSKINLPLEYKIKYIES